MNSTIKIYSIASKEDIERCRKVILELRPQLEDKDLWQLYRIQQKEQYRILYIRTENSGAAFIGFRVQNMFHSGKTLYIDDLCTLPEFRSRGFAGKLLKEVFGIARKENCDTVSLDSGHQRHSAHKLYLNQGLVISSHHFQSRLK